MKEFKKDPEWQAAHAAYVDDYPDENDADRLVLSLRAAFRLYEIERRYAEGESR